MTENNIPKWEQKYVNYHKALLRLSEIVNAANKRKLNDFENDGLVQRFEFTHESCWKLMKSYAEFKGVEGIGGSKDATRHALELGLIDDGDVWMEMIRSRNETSHNYDGSIAEAVINNIINVYYPDLVKIDSTFDNLSYITPVNLFQK